MPQSKPDRMGLGSGLTGDVSTGSPSPCRCDRPREPRSTLSLKSRNPRAVDPVISTHDTFALRNATRDAPVAEPLVRPRDALARMLGLLVRPPLRSGEGLWLDPCGGIHTWGMGYSIDILFLDRDLRVLGIAREVKPWRLVFAPRGTRSVVELPAGGAKNVEEGDQLEALTGSPAPQR
jgi:uncharacterized protein